MQPKYFEDFATVRAAAGFLARRTAPLAALLALLCLKLFPVVADDAAAVLVLRGGAVFDPVAKTIAADRTIVIEGSRIRAVGGAETAVPVDARVLDCRGKFLIPGLIDAHVHLVHLADLSQVAGDQYLPMFLAHGVTSVRDTGDPIVAQAVIARYAEQHPEICPRVFLCSPLVDREPVFHLGTGYALTDPTKVPAFVRDMVGWNVTTLKIYVGTPAAIGRQVIKEGHRAGLKVTAHLGAYTAQDAVLDGIDCLEHIESVFNYIIPPDVTGQQDYRSHLDLHNERASALLAGLAQHNVNVDPTLVVFRNMIYLNDVEEVNQSPDLLRVPRRMLDYWQAYRQGSNLPPATRDARRKLIGKYQELTGLLHNAGVKLLVGTDAPEPFVPPGASMHQELEMFVGSGLTPSEALAAATINVAEALGQQQELGTITAGKLADLVILDADPTVDIRHARKIHAVVHGGHVCDPQTVLKAVPAR